MYEMDKIYKIPIVQKCFWSPPTVSTHNGLTYNRANFSASQAMTSCAAYGWGLFISAQLLLVICLLTYIVADLYAQSPMLSIYILKISSALISICRSFTWHSMSFYHSRVSPSDEKWLVGWMQPDLFPCKDNSLVISIGQGYLLDDERSTLVCHWYWSELLAR